MGSHFAHWAKPLTEEEIASLPGRNGVAVIVEHGDTSRSFRTQKEAAQYLGVPASCLRSVLYGARKQYEFCRIREKK
jgi:hypothetical protein